ncbi:MAG: diacylglycerol kinase [Chloroherpetonaceae bacterium]|nr:diacylglycerol kinase [Chthonomonadaceae bacterium]MDW8206512.1 diacylglycerol kinase [Chloroherpetonaceae bacterium]
MAARQRPGKGISGFKHAQEGILYCFRTQAHMRYHFYIMVAVLLSGLLLNLDNRDMLVLVFAVTLVIVAEMFNTAVEAVVDLITENYNPIAKLAKDVAAGAVLLAAMNAIIAGILIFFGQKKLMEIQNRMEENLPPDVTKVVVVGIVSLALIVIISKLLSNTGSPWHGGIISGHSAIGFLLAMTIFFTSRNPVIAFLAILLAILVAQSRVEAGVHSLQEVVLGAVLAILLTSLVYWVMPRVRMLWRHPGPQVHRPMQFPSGTGGKTSTSVRIEGVSRLATSPTQ